MNIYKKTSSYKPGKKDPFSLSVENTSSTNGNKNNNGNTSNGDNGNNQNTDTSNSGKSDPNSTGTFFNDTGIK